jgi:hypothetical protein
MYNNEHMDTNGKLIWSALEYEEKERSKDWFWALGVIVVTSSIASIIFGNYFFAALLILSGVLLGFFAIKKPDLITYELNEKGLKIHNRLYPYENIKAFWVQLEVPHNPHLPSQIREFKPMLFIKSERAFMPIIGIPIMEEIAEEIHSLLLSQNIIEEEMKEHPSEKIMEALGF